MTSDETETKISCLLSLSPEQVFLRMTIENIDIVLVADSVPWDEVRACAEVSAAGAGLPHRLLVVAGSHPGARDAQRLRAVGVAEVFCDPAADSGAALRNLGLRSARSEFVVLVDARARPQQGWLEPLVRAACEDARVGAAGGLSVHPDNGKVLQAGLHLGEDCHPLYHCREEIYEFFDPGAAPRRPPAVSGHCLLVRRSAATEAGGFDESYRGEFDDFDFCLRLRELGHEVALCASSLALHRESSRLDSLRHRRENLNRLKKLVESSDVLRNLLPRRCGEPTTGDRPPLASLLYPAYNDAAFLEENIESIINQTYRGWELVVVNDASTDASPEILEQYRAAYPEQIRVIHKANHDRYEAWEICYARSTGDYVAILGADDVLLPWCLAEQVRALEASRSLAFVYGDVYFFDSDGKLIERVCVESPEPGRQLIHLLKANYMTPSSVLLRRSLVEESGGWMNREFMYAQDYDLFLRLLHGREKRHLGRPLVKYRVHRAQLSALAGRKRMFGFAAAVIRDKLALWRPEDFFTRLDLDTADGLAEAYREIGKLFFSPQTAFCGVQADVLDYFSGLLNRKAEGAEARRAQGVLMFGTAYYLCGRRQYRRAAAQLLKALRSGAAFHKELYLMLFHLYVHILWHTFLVLARGRTGPRIFSLGPPFLARLGKSLRWRLGLARM